MAELSIDDLLEELHEDGVMDSTGSFTLDPEKAAEKLRNFSFASPYDYILKFVQCAVAGGATRVNVTLSAGAVELQFDGEPFLPDDMLHLMNHLLTDSSLPEHRRHRHLAAGLRGAVAVGPSSICFESWNGAEGFRRTWDEDGWALKTLGKRKQELSNSFSLNRTISQKLSAVGAILFGTESSLDESSTLRARCQYSPAEIWLEGKKISGFQFGSPRYQGYEISQDPNPGEARPAPYINKTELVEGLVDQNHHLCEYYLAPKENTKSCLRAPLHSHATITQGASPGEVCHMLLAVRTSLQEGEVIYLEDGITLESKKPDSLCHGVLALCSAESFKKDLTGFRLVEDESFHQHNRELVKITAELRKTILENLRLFPIRERLREYL